MKIKAAKLTHPIYSGGDVSRVVRYFWNPYALESCSQFDRGEEIDLRCLKILVVDDNDNILDQDDRTSCAWLFNKYKSKSMENTDLSIVVAWSRRGFELSDKTKEEDYKVLTVVPLSVGLFIGSLNMDSLCSK